MSRWLERSWQRLTPAAIALYPLSLAFRAVVALRRFAYSAGLFRRERLTVPVIVVGNITVGGTGKTPLVLWLASFLLRHGFQPGIVSRGYGTHATAPRAVTPESDPHRFGDEPVLLAQRSGCPVWIGRDRAAVARALLAAHPSCNAILSDDGLQHYRLARDFEIAVIDAARGLGNGLMLPAGPLREPALRLRRVDAVVVNGPLDSIPHASEWLPMARKGARESGTTSRETPHASRWFTMALEGRQFRNLLNPGHTVEADHFQRQRVCAIAGIGHPPRFFSHLDKLGLSFQGWPFRDHHRYVERDLHLIEADAIVMTEKDAVKCAAFASEKHWVLPVDAVPDPGLGELVLRKLQPT